jgi:hypothetical protein
MDLRTFTEELLNALAAIGLFPRIALQSEGPVSSGYAYTDREEFFLRFYFNELTGTVAFALIKNQQRIWGVDYDNRRGWHLHPETSPTEHIALAPLSVADIIAHLQQVVLTTY